jgi:hypothetical protein
MTRDDIVTLLERHVAALLHSDASQIPSLYTTDATVLSPMFGAVVGHGEIAESFVEGGQIYADRRNTLEVRLIDGDRAIEVHTIRAIHAGEIFGVPPSHKQITFTIVFILDLRDGKIAQERRLYDFTSVLVQLGVLRAKPA